MSNESLRAQCPIQQTMTAFRKEQKIVEERKRERAHLPGTAVWSASFSVLANLLTLVLLKFSLSQHQELERSFIKKRMLTTDNL